MKNEVIVKPNYTRYKIYNERRFRKGTIPKGSAGFCYEDDKSLSFINFRWYSNGLNKNSGFSKSRVTKNKLLLKNGKLNIFSITRTRENFLKIRNVSRNGKLIEPLNKRANKKIQKRTIKILRAFLKKKNIKYKWNKQFNLNQNLLLLLYPALRELNIQDLKIESLPSAYSVYFRQPTLQLAIKKCFGFKGKKLQKLVYNWLEKNKNLDIFVLGAYLKGLIPIDNIMKLGESCADKTRDGRFGWINITNLKDVRKFLKNYNKQKIYNLLYNYEKNDNEIIFFRRSDFQDTINMYSQYGEKIILPKHPKDFKEIHDYLSKEVLKIQNEPVEIKYPEKIKKLNGIIIDNLKIELPFNTHVLIDWGQKMNNCIGGYQQQAAKNQVLLLGIYKDNKLTYNISIRNKILEQFYGPRNSNPDDMDKEKIIKILEENEIISSRNHNREDDLRPIVIQNQNQNDQLVEVPF